MKKNLTLALVASMLLSGGMMQAGKLDAGIAAYTLSKKGPADEEKLNSAVAVAKIAMNRAKVLEDGEAGAEEFSEKEQAIVDKVLEDLKGKKAKKFKKEVNKVLGMEKDELVALGVANLAAVSALIREFVVAEIYEGILLEASEKAEEKVGPFMKNIEEFDDIMKILKDYME